MGNNCFRGTMKTAALLDVYPLCHSRCGWTRIFPLLGSELELLFDHGHGRIHVRDVTFRLIRRLLRPLHVQANTRPGRVTISVRALKRGPISSLTFPGLVVQPLDSPILRSQNQTGSKTTE